jgi:aspartate/methionine/tyrosine aminotransferase
MRNQLTNKNYSLLRYSIREIVDIAQKVGELDSEFKFVGENIGDPIAKGWPVPQFLKNILIEEINREGDKVFGYSHSRGNPQTRKWIAEYARRFSPSSKLDYEYVLITSGLGAAIAAMYDMLPAGARVLQPTPSYPTHASLESFAATAEPITYNLDPEKEWQPDIAQIEDQIKKNPEITAVLVINPNNPTGAVFSKEILEKIVSLAEKYKLMVISDEVYFRMVYNGHTFAQITEIAQGRVPLIVMRGLSKDVPWPGGRCGWMEFHNVDLDPDYREYADSVKKKVMMEVCSTTLPQVVLPKIYEHPEYEAWLASNNKELEANGNSIADILNATEGLFVNRTNGAFYMMPRFKDGALNGEQKLQIKNEAARKYIEEHVSGPGFPLDKRFAYYLLAATGICVVPASGFYSPYSGFRITTLDRDPARRKETYARVSAAVKEYLAS